MGLLVLRPAKHQIIMPVTTALTTDTDHHQSRSRSRSRYIVVKQYAFEFPQPKIDQVVLEGVLPCRFGVLTFFQTEKFGHNGLAKRLRGSHPISGRRAG